MINDISRAFFHAKAKREVFVQLPQEELEHGEERICGRLNYSMYGTRDAAQNWFEEYSQSLIEVAFKQGIATPCVFYHEQRAIRTYVHGDDYVSTGTTENLQWLKTQLENKYQVKTQVLGPGEGQMMEVTILNRIVSWNSAEGIIYEADPRHTEIIIEQLGLCDAKTVSSPGTKEEGRTQPGNEHKLNTNERTKYWAIVARCNYLSRDRPEYYVHGERIG